jgi:hypothetical protein
MHLYRSFAFVRLSYHKQLWERQHKKIKHNIPGTSTKCSLQMPHWKNKISIKQGYAFLSFMAAFSMTGVVIPPLKSTRCKGRLAVPGRQLSLDGGGKYKGKRWAADQISKVLGKVNKI